MMSDEAALHETAGRQISVWHLSAASGAIQYRTRQRLGDLGSEHEEGFGKLSVEGDSERLSLDAWGAVVS